LTLKCEGKLQVYRPTLFLPGEAISIFYCLKIKKEL
jgi:hypothetical protein